MKNSLYKKGVVFGIIILFIGMSVLSSVSSKDISISKDKILKDDDEIEPLDTNIEIFTFIRGYSNSIRGKRITSLIYLDVTISADVWGLTISGIKFPSIFFTEDVDYVKVPFFIGYIRYDRSPYPVNGFAFGNIEWEPYFSI